MKIRKMMVLVENDALMYDFSSLIFHFAAIATGCIPLDMKEGREIALTNNIATQAKERGYETVSFSSRKLIGVSGKISNHRH